MAAKYEAPMVVRFGSVTALTSSVKCTPGTDPELSNWLQSGETFGDNCRNSTLSQPPQ